MNSNEKAIYDAVTFLIDYRNIIKTILNETEIERLNKVQRGLTSALEASINADPIFKGAFDKESSWGGGYQSHKEFMKTGISILP